MNRREALQALVSLPAVKSIAVVEVKPTDVIVVECDRPVSEREINHISGRLEMVWPDRRILILHEGLHLKIARDTL